MTWEVFYLICFGVGLALTVLSFAGGLHHHSLHLGARGGLHGPLHGSPHGGPLGKAHAAGVNKAGINKAGMSPLNGFTLTAFLCWFGGAGYLLEHYGGIAVPVILLLATLSGLAGGLVIFWFLAKVLLPHDRALTAEETRMTGVIGRVSCAIRDDGTGEILFSQNGARRSSPARSDDGQPIPRGVEVVVMRYERGIAYVRRWDEVSGTESLPADGSQIARTSKEHNGSFN
jgi:hypothetical protein